MSEFFFEDIISRVQMFTLFENEVIFIPIPGFSASNAEYFR